MADETTLLSSSFLSEIYYAPLQEQTKVRANGDIVHIPIAPRLRPTIYWSEVSKETEWTTKVYKQNKPLFII